MYEQKLQLVKLLFAPKWVVLVFWCFGALGGHKPHRTHVLHKLSHKVAVVTGCSSDGRVLPEAGVFKKSRNLTLVSHVDHWWPLIGASHIN